MLNPSRNSKNSLIFDFLQYQHSLSMNTWLNDIKSVCTISELTVYEIFSSLSMRGPNFPFGFSWFRKNFEYKYRQEIADFYFFNRCRIWSPDSGLTGRKYECIDFMLTIEKNNEAAWWTLFRAFMKNLLWRTFYHHNWYLRIWNECGMPEIDHSAQWCRQMDNNSIEVR